MSNQVAREFAELTRDKRDLEAKLNKTKSKLAQMEDALMSYMAEEGLPSISITAAEVDVPALAEQCLLDYLPQEVEPQHVSEVVDILNGEGLLADSKPQKRAMLSIGSRIWASPRRMDPKRDKATEAEYRAACRAIEAAGHGEFVQTRFNVISFSSFVKEMVQNKQITMGEKHETTAFDDTVQVVEKFQINSRLT